MKNKDEKLFFSMTFEFLEVYMKVQMMRSLETVKSYCDVLTVFRHYLRNNKNISISRFTFRECTRDLILDFLEYLKASGNKPGTRNQRLTVIKTYLWFAADKDISLQSIALEIGHIHSCKNPTKERPVIPEDAMKLLLEAPDNSKMGVRNRTLIILLYDSAARIDEILSLRKTDLCLDKDSAYIHVLGKGHKERVIAVTNQTCEHLRHYMNIYHSKNNPSTDFIFYTVIKGDIGKMSEANVERFLQQYATQVRKICPAMPESVYPHMLRRTRATNLYQNGIELPLVSRILGHAQLETTRIYAVPSLEMMRNALEANPPTSVKNEKPIWDENADELMAKMCGLR